MQLTRLIGATGQVAVSPALVGCTGISDVSARIAGVDDISSNHWRHTRRGQVEEPCE